MALLHIFFVLLLTASNSEIGTSMRREILEMEDSSWDKIKQGEWIIKFYAPWCSACKNFEPIWNEIFKYSYENGKSLQFAQVNVDEQYQITMRFFIMALPTIIYVKDGEFREYGGAKSAASITNYIFNDGWKSGAKLPWYRHPSSFTMNSLVRIATIAKYATDAYDNLVEKKHYPGWFVIVFAVLLVLAVTTVFSLVIANIICFVWNSIFRDEHEETVPIVEKKESPKVAQKDPVPDINITEPKLEEEAPKIKKRITKKEQ